MRVIVYDCTDRPELGYKSPTLRIFDDEGRMVLQGVILAGDGRHVGEKIAAGLGVPCEWIGPTAVAGVVKDDSPAVAEQAAAAIAERQDVPLRLKDGWLFDVLGGAQ